MDFLTERELPESATLQAGPRFSLRPYLGSLLGISVFMMTIGRRVWGNQAAFVLLGIVTVFVIFAALLRRFRCRAQLSQVTFSRKHLQIERPSGVTEVELARIVGLAVSRQDVYSEGRWLGSDRKVGIWHRSALAFGSDAERFDSLVFQVAPENSSILEGYLRLIQDSLLGAAESKLKAGDTIGGDGWRWNASGLTFAGTPQTEHDPASEYLTCESLHGKLRIWQAGLPTPIAVLSEDGRDVWLLRELIERRTPARPPREAQKSGPLGRLIFERRATESLTYRLWCAAVMTIGAIVLAIALLLLLFSIGGGGVRRVLAPTIVLGALGAGTLRMAWKMSRASFKFYDNAVRKQSLAGDRILLLSDIDVFSFDARRQRSYGRYTGTRVSMVFADLSRSGVGLYHSLKVPHLDEEIEELRESVASHLAARMARTLGEMGRMQWTPELWFNRHHLTYRPRGWLRNRAGSVDLPYVEIARCEELDGSLQIWSNDSEKPAVKVRANSPNYYPGLIVFERLLALAGREVEVRG